MSTEIGWICAKDYLNTYILGIGNGQLKHLDTKSPIICTRTKCPSYLSVQIPLNTQFVAEETDAFLPFVGRPPIKQSIYQTHFYCLI